MYELKNPETAGEWDNYHAIRRAVLFEESGRHGVYDPDHPDEYEPQNYPFLLVYSGHFVGTVRMDLWNDNSAIVRLVAVREEERRKGHGQNLLKLAEEFARRKGKTRLLVNAAPEALDFYKRHGFAEEIWDAEELEQPGKQDCVQMVKAIKG